MPNGQIDASKGAPNSESYTNNGDGTVSDNVTGLVWQQVVPPGTYTQPMAVSYCAGLSLGGRMDWRLPSAIELVSIVDPTTSNPSINPTYFPGAPATYMWSSTLYAGGGGMGWVVSFGNGNTNPVTTTGTEGVRCVR
jgi:hypothetical protein